MAIDDPLREGECHVPIDVNPNFVVDDLLDMNFGNWDWDHGTFSESGVSVENVEGLSTILVKDEDDSDKNYDEFNDSDYEFSDEDDRLYADNVDENVEWAGTLLSNNRVSSEAADHNSVEGDDMVYEDEGDSTDSDDGFCSWDEEDGEDINSVNKVLVFKSIKEREEPIFEKGTIFRNRKQLVEAIRQHSILNGKEIRFLKNETTRVRAKCKTYKEDDEKIDCPWEISATNKAVANKTLQVKFYDPNHNCGRVWNNKLMNSNWLARVYFDDIRITPNMKVSDLREKIRHEFHCDVSHLDIQIANEPTWTIISDKQKGLENAIKELLPSIEHRHCVRHLHNNFKTSGFSGQVLKEKMWNLARASYVGKFKSLMEELEKEHPQTFAWLSHSDRNPCHWSRSHFVVSPKCDILLNNLCVMGESQEDEIGGKPIQLGA